jgi:osmoprotectant transport system permease protein
MPFSQYISIFGSLIIDLTIAHIWLFALAFVGATVLGVLFGVMVYRLRAFRFLVPVVNVLQATPEIVLLALAIPFLGIGYVGALVPLFVKGVLPVMQNTLSGLQNVAWACRSGRCCGGSSWSMRHPSSSPACGSRRSCSFPSSP